MAFFVENKDKLWQLKRSGLLVDFSSFYLNTYTFKVYTLNFLKEVKGISR